MALINNIWVFVESEDVTTNIESSSHPVEQGEPITDHVQKQPRTLTINGKIVTRGNRKAADVINQIESLQVSGSLITYVGRCTLTNLLIQDFQKTFVNTNWGGCDFSMTLKEVRIGATAFVATKKTGVKNTGTQQVSKSKKTAVYHKVKKGDTCWALVTKTYKSLTRSGGNTMTQCNWIMSKNPSAFSRKGDFRTLQIGKKILVGYRK